MIALYILSLAVFIVYVGAILIRFGVSSSISESYYLLTEKTGKPLFHLFCLFTAIPLMAFWLDISEGTMQFLIFLGCAPLAFVGAAGAFKDFHLTGKVHFVSAGMCAVFTQAWIVIYTHCWISLIALLVGAFILSKISKGAAVDENGRIVKTSAMLYFLEIAVFINTFIGVLVYYANLP